MTNAPEPGTFGGSDRQLGFIRSLLNDRMVDNGKRAGDNIVDGLAASGVEGMTIEHFLGGITDKREASRLIDWLLTLPRYVAPTPAPCASDGRPTSGLEITGDATQGVPPMGNGDAPIGLHEHNGEVYRVVKGRESGNLYAKRMVPTEGGAPVFEYAGRRPLYSLDESTLMPHERAVEIGQLMEWCIFDHPLEDPLSIVRGIGPTCEKNHFPNAPKRTAQAKRDAEQAIRTEAGKAHARAEYLAAVRGVTLSGVAS